MNEHVSGDGHGSGSAELPRENGAPPVTWPDELDEILTSDLTVVVGMPTPKAGVSLATVTTLGLRSREAGTVSFTTSLGFGRKLERIVADPRIAVAYHTRQHGLSSRPGYILVQGRAVVRGATDAEREDITERATRFMGSVATGWFWDRWLAVYYYDRVIVDVAAERILWWPSGDNLEDPEVLGAALPTTEVPTQSPPRDPTVARVPMATVAKTVRKLPHQLLGVVQADGMPLVLPARAYGRSGDALRLDVWSSLLPRGGRRAGYVAHDFRPKLIGLSNATHTGWLEVDDDERRVRWTPHTRHAFVAPPNKTLLLLGNGFLARQGYKQALKEGRDRILAHAGTTMLAAADRTRGRAP
jgi:hypothetical protein